MEDEDKRVSDEEFNLDTSGFDAVAGKAESLAIKLADLKNELDQAENQLIATWVGEGRNQFEKSYRILTQLLKDLANSFDDIADSIYSAEEAYIQTDVDIAKKLEGKDSRF